MDGLARASGAGVPISFEGETLILDPIVLNDYGVIEQYLLKKTRPNIIALATEVADDITTKAEAAATELLAQSKPNDPAAQAAAKAILERAQKKADALMNKAFAETRKVNMVSQTEAMEFIDSPAGLAFCVWIKFADRYPGRFSLEKVNEIIQKFSEDQVKELMEARDQASARDIVGNSTGLSQNQTTPTAPNEVNQVAKEAPAAA